MLIFKIASVIGVLILIVCIYYLIKAYKKKESLVKFGKLNMVNCATEVSDECNDINDLGIIEYKFNLNKNEFNKMDTMYVIKLLQHFIKYVKNISNQNNSISIPGATNNTLITLQAETLPLVLSYTNSDKTSMFFIIRGTLTFDDLINDTKYNYYSVSDNYNNKINIHQKYNEIYNKLKSDLFNIPDTVTNIYIFGISMGAALGYIFANDISNNNKYKVNVIGVAPPRTGNQDFVDDLIKKCNYVMSIINFSDIVPTVPWTYMPNLIDPYTPVQFSQVLPATIINHVAPSLQGCHFPLSYYNALLKIKDNNACILLQ